MPYVPDISQDAVLAFHPDEVFGISEGELNFFVTTAIDTWLGPEPNYRGINAVIGVLECAKQELYRRVAVPYEEGKKAANGDVYQSRPFMDDGSQVAPVRFDNQEVERVVRDFVARYLRYGVRAERQPIY